MQSQSKCEDVCVLNYLYENEVVNTLGFQALQEFHSNVSSCKMDVEIL